MHNVCNNKAQRSKRTLGFVLRRQSAWRLVCSPARQLDRWSTGCFTKPRNDLQISTEIFILTGGIPQQAILMTGVSGPGCHTAEAFLPKNNPRIFRLRFTPLKMTTMFLFRGSEGTQGLKPVPFCSSEVARKQGDRAVGCFTKPHNDLQISTEIFILTGGWYSSPSDLGDH